MKSDSEFQTSGEPEVRPGFHFCEGRYYIGFWYVELPNATRDFPQISPFGKGGNYTMLVWRVGTDDGRGEPVDWVVQYRFRYYRDDRIHDHGDRMEWYHGTTRCTAEEAERCAQSAVEKIAASIDAEVEDYPIHGDFLRFEELTRTRPPQWLHRDARTDWESIHE